MAGELLGFGDVNLLQRIAEAYALFAIFFICIGIPIGLIYRQFVLKRSTMLAVISVIIGFYALTFFFVQLLVFSGMILDNAMVVGMVLGFITTAAVTALFARVINRRPSETRFDGLKFSEKRRDRHVRQGVANYAAQSSQKSASNAPAMHSPATTAPKPATKVAAPAPKRTKDAAVRIQRADEIGEVDWERETQRWAADDLQIPNEPPQQ